LRIDISARRLDAIEKRRVQRSTHRSVPRTRVCGYGVILILILSGYFFQTSDEPMVTFSRRPASVRPLSMRPTSMPPAAPPVQQAVSTPEPVPQAPETATLDTSMTLAPEKPVIREEIAHPKLPLLSVRDKSVLEDGGFLVRHLDRRTNSERNFSLLGVCLAAENTGALALGRLQAGYGRIFADNSVIACGRNGTAWEEKSCFYLKTCFRF
jgi:hypothetical protein